MDKDKHIYFVVSFRLLDRDSRVEPSPGHSFLAKRVIGFYFYIEDAFAYIERSDPNSLNQGYYDFVVVESVLYGVRPDLFEKERAQVFYRWNGVRSKYERVYCQPSELTDKLKEHHGPTTRPNMKFRLDFVPIG